MICAGDQSHPKNCSRKSRLAASLGSREALEARTRSFGLRGIQAQDDQEAVARGMQSRCRQSHGKDEAHLRLGEKRCRPFAAIRAFFQKSRASASRIIMMLNMLLFVIRMSGGASCMSQRDAFPRRRAAERRTAHPAQKPFPPLSHVVQPHGPRCPFSQFMNERIDF